MSALMYDRQTWVRSVFSYDEGQERLALASGAFRISLLKMLDEPVAQLDGVSK